MMPEVTDPRLPRRTSTTRSTRSRRRNSQPTRTCTWALRTWDRRECSPLLHRHFQTAMTRTRSWTSPPRTWPSPSWTAGPRRVNTAGFNSSAKTVNPSTLVQSAARTMRQVQTCLVTSKRTGASTLAVQRSATSVGRCTFQCRHSPCTSSPTTSTTGAMCVEKPSPGLGFCKGIYARTPARSLTCAQCARSALRTDRTFGLTCRHIRRPKIFNAPNARRRLHSSPTWTSTTSRPAWEALILQRPTRKIPSPFLAEEEAEGWLSRAISIRWRKPQHKKSF